MTWQWQIGAGVGVLALLLVGMGLWLLWRSQRALLHAEADRLRSEISGQADGCNARIETLRRQVQAMEECADSTEQVLREGRLNGSARAHAFELLRTGVSPDKAASTIGIARREMRLLARVSQMLSAYR